MSFVGILGLFDTKICHISSLQQRVKSGWSIEETNYPCNVWVCRMAPSWRDVTYLFAASLHSDERYSFLCNTTERWKTVTKIKLSVFIHWNLSKLNPFLTLEFVQFRQLFNLFRVQFRQVFRLFMVLFRQVFSLFRVQFRQVSLYK